jgi:putative transposase
MAYPKRYADPADVVGNERTFFAASSILGKRRLLQSTQSAELFISVLYHYRFEKKYKLHAFVVMPDRFHVLLTLDKAITIERAMQFIKGGFAFRAGRELGLHPPIWQKGFYESRSLNCEEFARHFNYIHQNPLRKNLVLKPELYPFSSACPTMQVDEPPQRLKPPIANGRCGAPQGAP